MLYNNDRSDRSSFDRGFLYSRTRMKIGCLIYIVVMMIAFGIPALKIYMGL